MPVVVEMSGDEAKLFRSVQRMVAQQTKMEQKWKDVGKAGKAAGDKTSRAVDRLGQKSKRAFDVRGIKTQIAALVGAGGVLAAINRINAAYAVWLRNQREVSAAARIATDEVTSFVALQPVGTKEQRRALVAQTAARFGVTNRADAFDTVQAIQSVRGTFRAGLDAASAVFAATQVGIPVGRGRELEVAGAGLGAAPGQTIRQAFIAGQLSGRDPLTLAGAAPALKFFKSPLEALGFGAVLAGDIKAEQLNVFLKQAGLALSTTGALGRPGAPTKGFDARGRAISIPTPSLFERLGVQDASRLEKLEALKGAGLTDADKLRTAGLTELRQLEALISLIPKAEQVRAKIAEIQATAVPGVLIAQRRAAEAEVPEMRAVPLQRALESIAEEQKAFGGDRTLRNQMVTMRERGRAIALRRAGFEQALGMDLIDSENRAGPGASFLARLQAGPQFGLPTMQGQQLRIFETTMGRINSVLADFEARLISASEAADRINRMAQGGEAMMPPGEDR